MNELLARSQLFGLVAFGNGGGIITLAIIRHAERQLRVKMRGISGQHRLEPGDGASKSPRLKSNIASSYCSCKVMVIRWTLAYTVIAMQVAHYDKRKLPPLGWGYK